MKPVKLIGGPADGVVRLSPVPMPRAIDFSLDGKEWHQYDFVRAPQTANPSKGLQAGIYYEFEYVKLLAKGATG